MLKISKIAGIALGASLLFAGCSQTAVIVSPHPTPIASPTSAPTAKPITVTLKAQNNSGENGTAKLEDVGGGKTKVTISVTGHTSGLAEPAHIHTGDCTAPGNVLYPLTNVVAGKSETIVNASIAQILANGKTLINLHKSAQESNIYTSCGELPMAAK